MHPAQNAIQYRHNAHVMPVPIIHNQYDFGSFNTCSPMKFSAIS